MFNDAVLALGAFIYSHRKMSYTAAGKIGRSKEAALRRVLVIDIIGLIFGARVQKQDSRRPAKSKQGCVKHRVD